MLPLHPVSLVCAPALHTALHMLIAHPQRADHMDIHQPAHNTPLLFKLREMCCTGACTWAEHQKEGG